ncbi:MULTISPECIES: hypothetical protein [Psychrobacter]|uniref:hypothetical protein n=1 Tax=Psychrobacter TaxID=497 RepID=UPI000EC839F9|nr:MULTISPECIES: hypothetical protein [Psychrobacter]HCH27019.1 hypothetical protein [Psychrobacter sp.]
MTAIIEQINTKQLAAKLKELQAEFKQYDGLWGYLKAKPLNIDLDVNKDDIVIRFDLNQDNAITLELATTYSYGELVDISVNYIEVDDGNELYTIDHGDHGALLLQCKRIIHDAAYYKLLDEDSQIDTAFYNEVYA